MYANMGIGVSLLSLPALSDYYLREAKKIAQQLENRFALAWVLETTSLVRVGRGEWEHVKDDLETASDIFRQIREPRRWEQTMGLLGELHHLRGRYAESQAIQKETLASARQRGDNQFQFHELAGVAMNAIRLGNLTQASEFLDEARAYIGENNDLVEEIRFYGLSAQIHLQQGDIDAAKQSAGLAAERIAKVRPTAFYTFEGYAGVSEVYLAELEKGKNNEMLQSARRAVKALQQFGRVLPIGRPRAWLHQGLLDWAEGRQKKAFGAWEKSLGLAEQMSLPYEAARAHYEIGRHLEVNEPARQIHLQKAIEMFSEMGVKFELQKARDALSG
jgi:eukaryotic-like serine/threonine-protein kinase